MNSELRTPDGYCGGSREPDARRELWALRLERKGSGVTLALHGPSMGRQPIYGVHECLRPLLESLDDGCELYFLCRTAAGLHYNVNNVVAVELADEQHQVSASNILRLPDQFVRTRPTLLARRAQEWGTRPRAVTDARALLSMGVQPALFEPVWRALSQAGRDELAPEYLAWAPQVPSSRHGLSPSKWPTEWLASVCLESLGTSGELVAELERRGPSAGLDEVKRALAEKEAHEALCQPARLRPELLARLLPAREPRDIAVYADTLVEAEHPWGEFLSLSLQGTPAAQRKAKKLAALQDETWLGPLWVAFTCTYVNGLPDSAVMTVSPRDVPAACAHPLLPFFRVVTCKKTKKTRRCDVGASDYAALARVMLRHSLVELDCFEDTLAQLASEDLSRVTRLHDVDVLGVEPGTLAPKKLASLAWLQVRVMPGTSLQTLEWLTRDRDQLLAGRKPHLDLVFPGGASKVELERVRASAPRLHGCVVTLDGQAL